MAYLTLNDTTTKNDQDWKQKRGYTPWIVLTVVLLGLAAFYAEEIHGGNIVGGSSPRDANTTTSPKDKLELNLKCNPSKQNEY